MSNERIYLHIIAWTARMLIICKQYTYMWMYWAVNIMFEYHSRKIYAYIYTRLYQYLQLHTAHSYTLSHIHFHTHLHTLIHICTHLPPPPTHTHTHTYTHTHTHTHIHYFTQVIGHRSHIILVINHKLLIVCIWSITNDRLLMTCTRDAKS